MPFLCMSRLSPLKRGKNIHKHYQCCLHSIPVFYTWYVTFYICISDAFVVDGSYIISPCTFSTSPTNLPSHPWSSLSFFPSPSLVYHLSPIIQHIWFIVGVRMSPFSLIAAFSLNPMTNTMKCYLIGSMVLCKKVAFILMHGLFCVKAWLSLAKTSNC